MNTQLFLQFICLNAFESRPKRDSIGQNRLGNNIDMFRFKTMFDGPEAADYKHDVIEYLLDQAILLELPSELFDHTKYDSLHQKKLSKISTRKVSRSQFRNLRKENQKARRRKMFHAYHSNNFKRSKN